MFKDMKSCFYLKRLLEKDLNPLMANRIKYLLIDDLANEMDSQDSYDIKINIPPFKELGPDIHLYSALRPYL